MPTTGAYARSSTGPTLLDAALGGISRRTFYRWRELRLAPACIRLPNGELRVRRDVLNDWLAERAEGAAS